MSASLSIRAVDKIYQRRGRPPVHAVKALDMDVGQGEIVALLGSSGCGKTSTLRMIAGFEDVSAGSIALAGRRVERLAAGRAQRRHGLRGLFALSAAHGARQHRLRAEERPARPAARLRSGSRQVAALVEIEAILDRYPSSISGGQQQRAVAGAGAGARRRPLSARRADGAARAAAARGAAGPAEDACSRTACMTSIFVTHDQTEANALADRIAVMEGGVLQQFANQTGSQGTARQPLSSPPSSASRR